MLLRQIKQAFCILMLLAFGALAFARGFESSSVKGIEALDSNQTARLFGGGNDKCKTTGDPIKCDKCEDWGPDSFKCLASDGGPECVATANSADECTMTATMDCSADGFAYWANNDSCSGKPSHEDSGGGCHDDIEIAEGNCEA